MAFAPTRLVRGHVSPTFRMRPPSMGSRTTYGRCESGSGFRATRNLTFVAALAGRVGQAIDRLPPDELDRAAVLMTAHSLPRRVAEQEPGYLAQLRDTADAVAAAAGLAGERWSFCWQSAGHEPGEWMKPDFADLMPELASAGRRSVVVAPVQFLADHLEVLYDVDIGSREEAELNGLRLERIESLNTDPQFIDALATSHAARWLAEQFRPR